MSWGDMSGRGWADEDATHTFAGGGGTFRFSFDPFAHVDERVRSSPYSGLSREARALQIRNAIECGTDSGVLRRARMTVKELELGWLYGKHGRRRLKQLEAR